MKKLLYGSLALLISCYFVSYIALETIGDAAAVKKIQALAMQKPGVELQIKGVDHSLLNPLDIHINSITLTRNHKTIAEISPTKIHVRLLPLLQNNIYIDNLSVLIKNIQLSSNDIAALTTPSPQTKPANPSQPAEAYAVNSLHIKRFYFHIAQADVDDTHIKELTLEAHQIDIPNIENPTKDAALSIQLDLKKLTHTYADIQNLASGFTLRQAALASEKIQCDIFGEPFTASFSATLISSLQDIHLRFALERFALDQLKPHLGENFAYPIQGALQTNGSFTLANIDTPHQVQGHLKIQGKDISIQNINANALIEAYVDSNKASLLDAAGFLALGPVGLLASQGMKASQSIPGLKGGKTSLQHLHIGIDLDQGLAHFTDVAMSTEQHRLSIKGNIALESQTFDAFKMGFLNKKDCADLVQNIHGTLSEPEFGVGKSILKTIAAPVTGVGKKLGNAVTGGCKPFYQGVVAHP